MKLLLDTHVWLWALHAPERLSDEARRLIARRENVVYLSAVSAWEIAIKFGLGRLRLPVPPEEYVPSRMADLGMETLPIEQAHALRVASLPRHHRDPFDRLLVAQAQVERLTLVTADPEIRLYDVETVAAA
jgi:PIN domain nuclease of toxin-antitoxin system